MHPLGITGTLTTLLRTRKQAVSPPTRLGECRIRVNLFNGVEMSSSNASQARLHALGARLGHEIRSERTRRHLTHRALALGAGISPALLAWIEAGNVTRVSTYLRLGDALGLTLEVDLVDPRRRGSTSRAEDPVHAGMGEWLVRALKPFGHPIAVDEPYQHYQFAGRADVLSWRLDGPDLLHVENRTRFPNLQEAFGSYNAKRTYLPGVIAQRLGLRDGFESVTNVMAVLWSAEALHDLRIRAASFAAICPDGIGPFSAWLEGDRPEGGVHSLLVVVDPPATGRHRAVIGLDDARTVRPRYRGYADAAEAFRRAGR
jgi:transcriptional regulator with XRE-family HTH domain